MTSKTTSSNVCAPNSGPESIPDDDVIRGFLLALGAGPGGAMIDSLVASALAPWNALQLTISSPGTGRCNPAQAGINPPSLASAVWGLALGGGVSFGVGYSIGVIKTYVKPPQVN